MAGLYYVPTSDFVQKNLNAELLQGVTASATLNNVTAIPNLQGVMIIDRIDQNGTETPDKVEVISFAGVSGSTLVTLVRGLAGTSDQDHAVNAIVEFGPDIVWAQAILDSLANVVDVSTGAVDTTKIVTPSATQTLYNKMMSGPTLSSPTFNIGSDAVGDIFYRSSTKQIARLGLGSSGQVLTANASLPYWATASVSTDGWIADSNTWTYASASTFTISGDQTAIYKKGTRIKFTQSATVKYAVVYSSSYSNPNTTVTIFISTDYTLANAAISATYYSYETSPQGYPAYFNYTPTYGGFSGSPSAAISRYQVFSGVCMCFFDGAGGTSNATTFTITAPCPLAGTLSNVALVAVQDNGSLLSTPGHLMSSDGSATLNVYKTFYQGTWTSSGSKAFWGSFNYTY